MKHVAWIPMAFLNLRLSEKFLIISGIFMLAAIPYLEAVGFLLWLAVKIVYLMGIFILFLKK